MANPHPERTGKDVQQPTLDQVAQQRDREVKVLDLALSGKNGVQIAALLDIDKSTVTRILDRVWTRNEQPRVEQLRNKWDMRIEAALTGLWDRVLDGDVAATNAFVRLADRAAKMHGLDQQVAKDAGALAEALLADPAARVERMVAIRDELAELRAKKDAG